MDAEADRAFLRHPYVDAVVAAGGVPIPLPPLNVAESGVREIVAAILIGCQGVILSGGDDPRTEEFGVQSHPKATPLEPRRQRFEMALLEAMRDDPDRPVLGICLGMQLMALHAGGRLDQHLPDHGERYQSHWGRREHRVDGSLGTGVVLSHHRQAVIDPGSLTTVAEAPDGIIEAIADRSRRFYLGVQWHPEITPDERLGAKLLRAFIDAARGDGPANALAL